ncbi:rhomboid family intramembrane serine protease [Amphibacillus jilinensis]|uniref:rhomboid family intramembrane serine protease n=1 Tax=Amphibacillus jilinensis TaxID=1216008 RepID=UPI0002FA91EE|nr:rhomboid family intramembrane serine protease [Amphibacillus jilinensis]
MFFRNESFKDFIRFYPVVSFIVGLQMIIWLLMFFNTTLGDTIYVWGVGSNILVGFGQYWRLITPIFLHHPFGITHVLFNSFSLIIFGPVLEQMLGKFKFISVYLFTGIMGNVFTYLVDTDSLTQHLGASGAIYGLLGLFIYMSFFRQDLIDPASKQIIIIFSLIGLVMTFLRPGINEAAHLFGFIGGIALGPIILSRVRSFSPWHHRRRVVKDNGIQFDPNRWKKRRFRVNPNISALIWWVIVILAVLGVLSGLIL